MAFTRCVLIACLCALWSSSAERGSVAVAAQHAAPVIRVAVVNTPDVLLNVLLPAFQERTGYHVTLQIGEGAYDVARAGHADLVIAHYGHPGTEPFISEGLGRWPRAVFSNQAALIGPEHDPTGIRGLADAAEAFRLMVRRGGEFIVNNAPTERYLAEVLWQASGQPPKSGWWLDLGLRDEAAVDLAAARGAHTLWGVVPFVRLQAQRRTRLEALVTDDPLFQRMMFATVVNPARIPGSNEAAATTLQRYLLEPGTQARIREFRHHGLLIQTWWPAARHNAGADLIPFR